MNINQSHITVNNTIINEGLDTTIHTNTTSQTHNITPSYTGIATSAAISGAIAGAFVTIGELISDIKESYFQNTGRPVSQGPSTLLDYNTPNGGFVNSQLGVNILTDSAGKPILDASGNFLSQETGSAVSQWASSQNPAFQMLNILPGSPSFVDFHDAGLMLLNPATGQVTTAGSIVNSISNLTGISTETTGFAITAGTIPPFYALSQCVAMASLCANIPDLFINIGTVGLLQTNINNHTKPKPKSKSMIISEDDNLLHYIWKK